MIGNLPPGIGIISNKKVHACNGTPAFAFVANPVAIEKTLNDSHNRHGKSHKDRCYHKSRFTTHLVKEQHGRDGSYNIDNADYTSSEKLDSIAFETKWLEDFWCIVNERVGSTKLLFEKAIEYAMYDCDHFFITWKNWTMDAIATRLNMPGRKRSR